MVEDHFKGWSGSQAPEQASYRRLDRRCPDETPGVTSWPLSQSLALYHRSTNTLQDLYERSFRVMKLESALEEMLSDSFMPQI